MNEISFKNEKKESWKLKVKKNGRNKREKWRVKACNKNGCCSNNIRACPKKKQQNSNKYVYSQTLWKPGF